MEMGMGIILDKATSASFAVTARDNVEIITHGTWDMIIIHSMEGRKKPLGWNMCVYVFYYCDISIIAQIIIWGLNVVIGKGEIIQRSRGNADKRCREQCKFYLLPTAVSSSSHLVLA